ncbi:potassium/sodium hyperpolarization-activated cyclic nucleotide-gated channel 1-like [Tribolium madens]|uniref:potassium/sodium hyperpolarization-activated cyclic nucleotide-gated channel 1-like n=1 Tax=Tribolium madens TaxID=41895 RepID=UPI001CF73EBE|nr:potassium/sodium hyperpolarization-activated cyclic nucleotide-gated channel 1-like [Tribolium madens]
MGAFLCRFNIRKREVEAHRCSIKVDESMSFLPPLRRNASCFQRFRRSFKKSTLISERNPQSADYYRSKAEILRIRKEHVMSKSWIIHPFSIFRAYYEMWMTLVWILVLFLMPADAAFDLINASHQHLLQEERKDVPNEIDPLNLCLRLLSIIDIIMTFFTGFPVKKSRKVVMHQWKIAKKYIFSIYFITDLLASLPLELVISDHNTQSLVDVFSFLRIIRLPTLYFYMTRSLDVLGVKSITIQMLKNILVNYLVFHWFACFQYMIPQIRFYTYGEILAESWVERTDIPELPFLSKYIVCIYRAAGGLLCITFEEIAVDVWEEKLLALASFIFGKVYVFYITVLLLNFLLRQRSLEIKYFETISQVQAYMSQKQLPMSMQTRLLQFYDYKYNKKFFKERGITSLLSDKLRGEINLNVCSKLVQNVELLTHLPQQTLEQVVANLKAEIYLSNDIIIKAGSVGDCMYFLASGTVGVWTPSGKEVCHLHDGAYFGEISLVFKDKRRTANIVAVEICEVYKLDRRAFKNCFKTNSELYKMLEDVANERMEITQMYEDVHTKTFMEMSH